MFKEEEIYEITYSLQLDSADAGCVVVNVATGDVAHHLGRDVFAARQGTLLPSRYALAHRAQTLAQFANPCMVLAERKCAK